jgi:hypothetical protein
MELLLASVLAAAHLPVETALHNFLVPTIANRLVRKG